MSKNKDFNTSAFEVNKLALELKNGLNLNTSLYLKLTTYTILNDFTKLADEIVEDNSFVEFEDVYKKYDFVLGDLPFGLGVNVKCCV